MNDMDRLNEQIDELRAEKEQLMKDNMYLRDELYQLKKKTAIDSRIIIDLKMRINDLLAEGNKLKWALGQALKK